MSMDNDIRGWIMTCVSGIACVLGASIICVDLIIQRIPGKQDFRIQDNNAFLAGALSLSFGVMLFSSLNNMLPEAQQYLIRRGADEAKAAWITIGCFLTGVICIQVFSRILHHYMPSHVVDCDHTHEEVDNVDEEVSAGKGVYADLVSRTNGTATEHTPLMTAPRPNHSTSPHQPRNQTTDQPMEQVRDTLRPSASLSRRPTAQARLPSRVTTLMTGAKASCDGGGPCYGYSEPCGNECFKIVSRSPTRLFGRRPSVSLSRQPSLLRTTTTSRIRTRPTYFDTVDEEAAQHDPLDGRRPDSRRTQSSTQALLRGRPGFTALDARDRGSGLSTERHEHNRSPSIDSMSQSSTANETSHHHHVPSNAFMDIGLQTSIAIALHKLPEGFITYATNHANPTLGFSVFMALFIHNITEGFAMALPLYLAINSRFRAMLWSSLLGGVSQPLGAGIAALWFKIAGSGGGTPGDTVYGCMFSVTAGIMASVALQLFQESLTLTHSRTICTIFAFGGMAILGISHALTA